MAETVLDTFKNETDLNRYDADYLWLRISSFEKRFEKDQVMTSKPLLYSYLISAKELWERSIELQEARMLPSV